jgi:hypothetical protein
MTSVARAATRPTSPRRCVGFSVRMSVPQCFKLPYESFSHVSSSPARNPFGCLAEFLASSAIVMAAPGPTASLSPQCVPL